MNKVTRNLLCSGALASTLVGCSSMSTPPKVTSLPPEKLPAAEATVRAQAADTTYQSFDHFTYKTFDNAFNLIDTFNPFRDPNGKRDLTNKTGFQAGFEAVDMTATAAEGAVAIGAPMVKLPIDAVRAVGFATLMDIGEITGAFKDPQRTQDGSYIINLGKNVATNVVMLPVDLVKNTYNLAEGLVCGVGDGMKYVGNLFAPNQKKDMTETKQASLTSGSFDMPTRSETSHNGSAQQLTPDA